MEVELIMKSSVKSNKRGLFICSEAIVLMNTITVVWFWKCLLIADLLRYFVLLSYIPALLVIINAKSKPAKTFTYFLLAIIALSGAGYAIYCRRPFGLLVLFSAAIGIAYYFIFTDQSLKDAFLTKIALTAVSFITAALLVLSANMIFRPENSALSNGGSVIWDAEVENLADEICEIEETDEQKVRAIYTWVIDHIEYDWEYSTLYQHFDFQKTLMTKKGVCFDQAHIFAALCRAEGIPCLALDGNKYDDVTCKHAWNRVYFDGRWWNLDITHDSAAKAEGKSLYGFRGVDVYDAPDEVYLITRIC